MNQIRQQIYPGLRGAIFYGMYWGAIGIFDPFLYVYFMRLGIDPTQIGWLSAILPLCTLVIAPLVSRLADALHRRVVFLALACLGFGASLIVPATPGFNPTFPALVGFVALYSAFRSPIVSLGDSLVAQMALRHALDFGSMRLWGSIVFTIAAASLGIVWQQTGFTAMFVVTALAFLPVTAAALLLEEPARQPRAAARQPHVVARQLHAEDTANASTPRTRFVFDPGLLFLLSATFLIIAALFMSWTFASVYLIQLGGSETMAGIMMAFAAAGEVPGMLYGNRLARRIGPTNALVIAYGVIAITLAATALVHTPLPLLVLAMGRGLGFGLLLVSTVMIINTHAPKDFAATYQGILNGACWGLAPLLGGPISGWIYQTYGPSALFFTASGLALLSTILITPTYRIWKTQKAGAMPTSPEPAE